MRAHSYADITPTEPEWLMDGLIQRAGVAYVAGEGGVGKSMVIADWAARVTRGLPMPGNEEASVPLGSVMLVTSEDDPSLSTVWRLQAAGADLERVYDVTDDFTLPDSLPGLREDMEAIGDVRLVVIDPLAAVSSIPITSGNVRIRKYLTQPLERFARDSGASVVVIHHTVKSGRTAGSKAITDAARMVLRVARSAQDERIRVMTVDKTNIASDTAGAIAYTIAGTFPDVRVQYLALPDDEAPKREPTTGEKVLTALIASPTPVETQHLAQELGIAYGTVRTALTRLKQAGEVYAPKRGYWTVAPPEAPGLEVVK